ncbi:PsbP-related protein [Winogradskyella tangerina]|uniref:PsbP-related protein n=1 Tax=Winogradskyella tangerina TaxID=2023240 RepID=UPI000DBE5824|nr:PsbP-related protein [Winogradskyella tangerina]
MKTKIATLLSLFIGLMLFSQENDWTTYEKDNYSIQYPENWSYSDQKPQPSIQFVLKAEEASQTEDMFWENINLNTEYLQGQEFTLDEYIELSLGQIKKQVPTAKLLESEDITLNGMEAKSTIWSADFGNGFQLKFKQYVVLNAGTAYILTFTSTFAEFDKYQEVATSILDTFKINS